MARACDAGLPEGPRDRKTGGGQAVVANSCLQGISAFRPNVSRRAFGWAEALRGGLQARRSKIIAKSREKSYAFM